MISSMCDLRILKVTKLWFFRAIILVIIYALVSFIPKPDWICDNSKIGNGISAMTSVEALNDKLFQKGETPAPLDNGNDPNVNGLLQLFPVYLRKKSEVDSDSDIIRISQNLPSKMSSVKVFHLQNFNFSHFGRTWLNEIPEHGVYTHHKNIDSKNSRFTIEKLQQHQKLPDCVPLKVSHRARRTKICVHYPQDDNFISNRLRDTGMWELELVFQMEEFFMENPRSQLVDLGCHVGVYTLFAASMAKPVLAMDILPSNLALIQLSIAVNDENMARSKSDDEDIDNLLGYSKKAYPKYSNLITTVHNAIYSKHAKMYVYLKDDLNLGGTEVKELNIHENKQQLQIKDMDNTKENLRDEDQGITYQQNSPNTETNGTKILIDAICLDDLIPYIQANLSIFLKMDIEGSEPDVFLCASKFFMYVDIRVILMEILFHRYSKQGKTMANFLFRHHMVPSEDVNGRKLLDTDLNNMYKWPENLFWIKVR